VPRGAWRLAAAAPREHEADGGVLSKRIHAAQPTIREVLVIEASFDYATCVRLSERVAWKVDDVLPPGAELDFTRAFLPEQLAGGSAIAALTPPDRLRLNHTRAHGYVHLFHFVEEYIIAMVMKHAHAELFGDDHAQRALLRFADEELKHQEMFRRFGDAFNAGFGTPCGGVPAAEAVASFILSKSPLAVTVLTLHLELVTQRHYVDAFKADPGAIDPLFKSLFKHHWIEEAQHAKIDVLEMEKLARTASPEMLAGCLDEYAEICRAFTGVLADQARLDVESFERSRDRSLSSEERRLLIDDQRRAYHDIFLVQGMRNPGFVERATQLTPPAAEVLASLAVELAA
jgi:hypothetical protein